MLYMLQNGIGAAVSALKRLRHQEKKISEKYPNIGPQNCLQDLVVVNRDKKAIKSKETDFIFFHHDGFPNEMLILPPAQILSPSRSDRGKWGGREKR
eukprot:6424940-Ditylum_brightwellii.AAC.1